MDTSEQFVPYMVRDMNEESVNEENIYIIAVEHEDSGVVLMIRSDTEEHARSALYQSIMGEKTIIRGWSFDGIYDSTLYEAGEYTFVAKSREATIFVVNEYMKHCNGRYDGEFDTPYGVQDYEEESNSTHSDVKCTTKDPKIFADNVKIRKVKDANVIGVRTYIEFS